MSIQILIELINGIQGGMKMSMIGLTILGILATGGVISSMLVFAICIHSCRLADDRQTGMPVNTSYYRSDESPLLKPESRKVFQKRVEPSSIPALSDEMS
jgi:hypothetical protein